MQRMNGTILVLVAGAVLVGANAMAQEAEPRQDPAGQQEPVPAEAAEESEEAAAGAADDLAVDPELDDSDLDDQTYESDDDVFVPSEEIPADEPIPFPSDI